MTPSLYIVVDSTLRLGYSAKLIEIMNSEVGSGTILFSDPFLKTSDVFYPLYRSNKLRVVTQPFNMNDNCETLLEIFKKEAKSATIILPTKYKYCLKSDTELKSRTVFLDDNSSVRFDLDSNSGLYIRPQLYNSLKWQNLGELIGKNIVDNQTLITITEGGLINDQGKLRLEASSKLSNESPAILAVPSDEIFDEKTILNKMYSLAEKLQEENFEILNVEKRMDQDSVYVLKVTKGNAGINVIKYSPT